MFVAKLARYEVERAREANEPAQAVAQVCLPAVAAVEPAASVPGWQDCALCWAHEGGGQGGGICIQTETSPK